MSSGRVDISEPGQIQRERSSVHYSRGVTVSSSSVSTIERTDNERVWEGLVKRLAHGDDRALAQLYDSTNRLVYGMAMRILRDVSSAEDVTMEVYLQVWRQRVMIRVAVPCHRG